MSPRSIKVSTCVDCLWWVDDQLNDWRPAIFFLYVCWSVVNFNLGSNIWTFKMTTRSMKSCQYLHMNPSFSTVDCTGSRRSMRWRHHSMTSCWSLWRTDTEKTVTTSYLSTRSTAKYPSLKIVHFTLYMNNLTANWLEGGTIKYTNFPAKYMNFRSKLHWNIHVVLCLVSVT